MELLPDCGRQREDVLHVAIQVIPLLAECFGHVPRQRRVEPLRNIHLPLHTALADHVEEEWVAVTVAGDPLCHVIRRSLAAVSEDIVLHDLGEIERRQSLELVAD